VAKLGSIRKAADRLHVAPSAVSRQIAQLELELAAVLFERSKVGVQLTAAGEVLARHSHRIFRDLDRARSGIDDLRGLQRGEVSVWVIEGFVSGLLPDLLGNFHHRYPVSPSRSRPAQPTASWRHCWRTRPTSESPLMRSPARRSK
jgi:DNA-binding transcriptional LysR family regulator